MSGKGDAVAPPMSNVEWVRMWNAYRDAQITAMYPPARPLQSPEFYAARNLAMYWSRVRGMGYDAIAAEHDVCRERVRQIVDRERRRRREARRHREAEQLAQAMVIPSVGLALAILEREDNPPIVRDGLHELTLKDV